MLSRIRSFISRTQSFRQRYGNVAGLSLALQIRRTRNSGTDLEAIRLPGHEHPVFVRPRTVDVRVLEEIFGDQPFDLEFETPPKFIVDAGAHIGLASRFFAWRFPEAQIVALELEKRNFEVLKRNVDCRPQIHPLHCGLWSNNEGLCVENTDAETWAFVAGQPAGSHDATVPSMSIPEVLQKFGQTGIDLLKLDIEGAEKEVLATAGDWIGNVRTIAIELHDWLQPGCSTALEDAIKGHEFHRSKLGDYIILRK